MLNQEIVVDDGIVVENRPLGEPEQKLYKLVLRGRIADKALPGQFVHLKVGHSLDPLLRRPVSIAGINRLKGEVTLCYKAVGRGTELLTGVRENEVMSVIGPLGTGFTVPETGELLILAGGIGLFPLLSLIQAVDQSKVKIKLLCGGENRKFFKSIGYDNLKKTGIDLEVSTLDGSLGKKGLITVLLENYLTKNADNSSLRAAACGPKGMLKAISEICIRKNVPLEVSLEERMACGVGACLGCVCTVRGESGAKLRKRVCREGPVFNSREVVWDEDN